MRRKATEVRRIGARAVLFFCALAMPACQGEKTGSIAPKASARVYRCDGFAGPIKPRMEIQRGRTLPLKASLLDAEGKPVPPATVDPPPEIRMVRLEDGTETDRTEQAAAGDFGKARKFVFKERYWKFDLATADFPELGSYRAEMVSGDESRYGIAPPCAVTFVVKE